MPVDLVFELSYMLSDLIGREVVVEEYRYDREGGVLCVTVRVDSARGEACIPVRQCRTVPEERLEKCLAKALASNEKLLQDLAGRVAEETLSRKRVDEEGVSG